MLMIVGDVHGDFKSLKNLIEDKNPDQVLCLGDFGYFPTFEGKSFRDINRKSFIYSLDELNGIDVPIWWIDGNHEDHYSLGLRKSNENFPRKNIKYIPRGTVISLPDTFSELSGRRALFLGGAESIDAAFRTEYIDWWREESITHKDLEFMNDSTSEFDIIFSHTAPVSFGWEPFTDCQQFSRTIMDYILNAYHPKTWYFGHFHDNVSGKVKNCEYTCLSTLGQQGSYILI